MGNTFQADVPGNRYPTLYHNASVASDGGSSVVGIFRAPNDIKVQAAYWCPYGADQGAAASASASYRRVTLINGGTAGTGTTVIASINMSASKASFGNYTLSGTGTAVSGAMLVFSQETVGGTHATGTILRAGVMTIEYELI